MDISQTLLKYFPYITNRQLDSFVKMAELYPEWNAKINVISRADIGNVFERHILHSLSIGAFLGVLEKGTTFMDLGTGGGFPGLPLAVLYPECEFHLIDRIGKKIRVATEIAEALGLTNVTFQHGDSGECHDRFDYVVSRAVMPLDGLVKISLKNILRNSPRHNRYSPGLICLKGGDLTEEIEKVDRALIDVPVNDFINEEVFINKEIIYVPI